MTKRGFGNQLVRFNANYQRWFTEVSAVVKQLIHTRLKEFDEYYRTDSKRKNTELSNVYGFHRN